VHISNLREEDAQSSRPRVRFDGRLQSLAAARAGRRCGTFLGGLRGLGSGGMAALRSPAKDRTRCRRRPATAGSGQRGTGTSNLDVFGDVPADWHRIALAPFSLRRVLTSTFAKFSVTFSVRRSSPPDHPSDGRDHDLGHLDVRYRAAVSPALRTPASPRQVLAVAAVQNEDGEPRRPYFVRLRSCTLTFRQRRATAT
jgi:hypothetical protein